MINYKNTMPVYLNKNMFDIWIKNFNICIHKLGLALGKYDLSPYKYDINVKFSDEQKIKTVGLYTLTDIKKIIEGKWKLDKETYDILNRIKNFSDFHKNGEGLAGRIAQLNGCDYYSVKEILDNLYKDIRFTYDIFGEYDYRNNIIILYVKNIEDASLLGNRTKEQIFEETFIHELFHYYHYKNYDTELIRRWDYTKEIILESLASYFEVQYCIMFSIPDYDEIIKSWSDNSVVTYPYSGAKEIDNNGKFVSIFKTSLFDMDQALRSLLYSNDFYDVKNMVEVINKVKKVSVPGSTRKIYFVIQNKHFNEEKVGYIFAPKDAKHKIIEEVHEGDIIIHSHNRKIVAVSVVKSKPYYSLDSYGRKEAGIYVDCDYDILNFPINSSFLKIFPNSPVQPGPVRYLFELKDKNMITCLLEEIYKTNSDPFLYLLRSILHKDLIY